jgi:tetratricopeptide (TPR) repeat protein
MVDGNTQSQELLRELARSRIQQGDALFAQSNWEHALDAFNEALQLTEQLSLNVPYDHRWQHNQAVIHDRICRVHVNRGDRKAALAASAEAVQFAELCLKADPQGADSLSALDAFLKMNGLLWSEQGQSQLREQKDPVGALPAFQASLAAYERTGRLTRLDPAFQRGLAVAHAGVGKCLYDQCWHSALSTHGDRCELAHMSFKEAVTINERLAASAPDNAAWNYDLAENLGRLALVEMMQARAASLERSLEILELAQPRAVKAREICDRLRQMQPEDPERQKDFVYFDGLVADIRNAIDRRRFG